MPHAARRRGALVALFAGCAMILGGGGWPSPTSEMALELLWGAAALAWLWLPDRAPGTDRAAWALAALALALPVFQLVPLPSALWQGLPGQQDRVDALALVGAAQRWRPATLSPARTLAGLLALLPPVWLFLVTARLDARGREWLVRTVAAVALASALFGAVQVSVGEAAPRFYAASNAGLTGFQANKNAAADVLLIGLAACALAFSLLPGGKDAPRPARRGLPLNWPAFVIVALVFIAATGLTNSRAGIALIPVALAGAAIVLAPALGLTGARRWLPLAVLALLVAAAYAAAKLSTPIAGAMARFAAADDFRRELWRDGWFAMQKAWPSGVGLGGAATALIAAERLEVVDPSAPNRVHNDYLEFLLEGGALSLAILAAAGALLAWAFWRRWRTDPAGRGFAAFGATVLVIVGLHSLVDYPLRSMALACLTGMGAGLLFAPSPRRTEPTREDID